MKEVKLAKPAVGEEGILELAVIGQRVIARLNSSTVLEREVPGMSPRGPFGVRAGGQWIKDAEYMNLDGIADPLKELGWNLPATSPAIASTSAVPVASGTGTAVPSAPKLNVPIPEWLQKARAEGGRLVFHKTVDVSDYFDLGVAAKFDDFVEVYSDSYGWLARRSNGEVWGKTAGFDGKVASFGPVKVSSIHRGDQTIMIDEAGQIQWIYGGKAGSRSLFAPGASRVFGMKGTLNALVAMNDQGSVLGTFGFEAGLSSPPAEFFQNASLVGAGSRVFFTIETGKPVRGWNINSGTTYLSPAIPEPTAEMDIGGPTAILLSTSGKVNFVNTDGINRPNQVIPSGLEPAIRVRVSGIPAGLNLAQKTDGTWVAWDGGSDLKKLPVVVASLGPLIDVEGGKIEFNLGSYKDKPVKEPYLICIEPRSVPSPTSAPPAVAAALKAAPPPSAPATPSPSPPVSSTPAPAAVMPAASASELDQRLAAIEAGFQTAVERDANAAFKASMAALDKSYLGALDRALAAATSGGKLEEAIALREEKQRIEKGQGVPSEVDESTQAPGKVPDTLKTLRKTYRSTTAQHEATKAKAMQPLYDKYDQALAAVQTELTKAQKLDDALRLKTVREQVAATRGGEAAPPAAANGPAAANSPSTALAGSSAPPSGSTLLATKDKPFINSLGMKFVSVPGTDVLFCIHETRRRDYAAFMAENPSGAVEFNYPPGARDGIVLSSGEEHPVVKINWLEAKAFCEWLSKKDGRVYRLPSDREWSHAAGIGDKEKAGVLPEELSGKVHDV